jgi:dephospho-CoA kinase
LKKLGQVFGKEIFNSEGSLIYTELAKRVFSDKKELYKLNKLMFPLIKDEIKNILTKNSKRDYIIVDAAVLFDCGLDDLCDYIFYIRNSLSRRKLFLKNKGFSDDDIKMRIGGQHIKINKEKINFIVDNNKSKKDLFEKIEKIMAEI